MKGYLKISVHTEIYRVNELMEEGWELIDTCKVNFPNGSEGVEYHMGLPAETRIRQLKQIIRAYEKYGFKHDLVFQMSESYRDDLLSYTTEGGLPMSDTPLTSFLKMYEKVVNDQKVQYYIKEKHPYDDPELDEIDI
ncbi:hypothetical protein [Bacillus sp. FJAT-27251]|uniref:hypothetical protein n=1 Tax=Bacillus sp. FJAT-27251 TaxID=1684142 RepID=UPI0006A79459|nr:hypothetical protein [Bacillus sp. FJAT-27251]